MTVDVKKLFNEDLQGALTRNPEAARKIGGKYQINIASTGSWHLDLVANPPTLVEGTGDAQVTIDVTEPDFQSLVADPSAGTKLFFAGKLKLKGNQMLAMNLPKLFALK